MRLKLLKKSDFLILMAGKFVSLIGTRMQSFALSLYVLKVTQSATKFASVLAITMIPSIILGPIAGVLVDWLDRKKIIVYLDFLRGIIIGVYVYIFMVTGELSMAAIYIMVILLAMTSLVFQPAISTVIPSMVKKEELVDANTISSFIMNTGNFIAPLLAGLLLDRFGLLVILIINSVSFVVSSISEMFLKIPNNNKAPKKIGFESFKNDFIDGIKYIKKNKLILNIILIGLVINFAYNPLFSVGMTYISKRVLLVTDSQYGMFQSFLIISTFIAPILANLLLKKHSVGKLLFWDILGISVMVALIAIISSSAFNNLYETNIVPFISLIAVTFVIALFALITNVAINLIFQTQVPNEMMGRVGTVMTATSTAAIPLGQMCMGCLFDVIDAWICVSIISIILFVSILLFRKTLYREAKVSIL